MRTVLAAIELGARGALRLAPRRFRMEHGDELHHTLVDVCLAARSHGGLLAMTRAGGREIIDILRVSVRARIGRPAPLQPPAWRSRHPRKGDSMLRTVLHDVLLGFRSLAASRTYAALSVLTLALGIGITTAAFSLFDSLILRPVPFAGHDRFVELVNTRPSTGVTYPRFNRALFLEWRKQVDLFDRVEGHEIASAIWKSPRGSEMVAAAFLTPGMFSLLGAPPLDGRYFVDGDGRDGSDELVVISERFWRGQLGAAPRVVGTALLLNGASHTVVGVMPETFGFPNSRIDLWFPLDIAQPPARRLDETLSLTAFARVAPDVRPEAIGTLVEQRAPLVLEAVGQARPDLSAAVSLLGRNSPVIRQSLYVLAGAVAFLLLIVCANVANLSLARALARARDFAVRASLGASRRDLIRETLVEHGLVAAAGVGLGLVAAALTLEAARAALPPSLFMMSLNHVDLDPRALAFTALVGVATMLLCGLPPAVVASRPRVADVLRRDSRSSAGSRTSRRLRSALVVAEVTISIVLLVGAALMTRSFAKLQAVDLGFERAELARVRVGLPVAGYLDRRAQDRFTEAVLEALGQVPGVLSATAGSVPPDADLITFGSIEFEHAPDVTADQVVVPVYRAWPNYFQTTGIPVVEGRPFERDEPAESTIISRSFADRYWPGRSAVGGRFKFTGSSTWRNVIGVAGEVRQLELDDSVGSFEFYYPMRVPPAAPPSRSSASPTDTIAGYRTFVVRSTAPASVLTAARQAITGLDENVVIWDAATVEDQFVDAVARPRTLLFLLALFAGLGLLLAAAGLYGVLSYLVSQRLREIGIRLALGAEPRRIFRLVLRGGLTLTVTGLMLGVGLALGLVQVMRTLLYQVEPTDPVSVAGVAALLLLAATAASWRPARRAMRVDPVTLLREQ